MLQKLGDFFAEKVSRILPDSFVFAIVLTLITVILALFLGKSGSIQSEKMEGAYAGNNAAFLTSLTTELSGCEVLSEPFAVEGSRPLKVTARFKTTDIPEGTKLSMKVRYFKDEKCRDASDKKQKDTIKARHLKQKGAWEEFTFEEPLTVPDDAKYARLSIMAMYIEGKGTPSSLVYVDDVFAGSETNLVTNPSFEDNTAFPPAGWEMKKAGFKDIVGSWVRGVFNQDIIFFAFLMIMVLTFGFTIGVSPPFRKFFNWLVKYIRKPWQVYFFLVLISIALMLVNWGLAPVMAILAVEVCKRVKGVDYRVAIASFYSGLLVWHGGLSSSAPLMMATEETARGFIDQGIIMDIIPVTDTLLIPTNFALIASVVVVLPLMVLFMRPKSVDEEWDPAVQFEKKHGSVEEQEKKLAAMVEASKVEKKGIADWLNHSPIVSIFLFLLALLGAVGIITGKGFNLAALAFIMLALGILLHWRPISYVNTMKQAIMGSSDIVLQFPLFGGIMGIFITTGLAQIFARGLLSFATANTIPWFAFLTSSIVNLFIPSGGGEWLVLGAPLLKAATIAGAPIGKTIIAFAYGDALTNLINPFWTLTFLPIMGQLMNIRPRDFMGYTVLICLVFFVIESAILLLI